MAWHKFATVKTDGDGFAGVLCQFGCASAQGVDYEVHVVAETKPDTISAIDSGSSSYQFDTNADGIVSVINQSPNTSYQLWLDLTTQTYTSLLVYTYGGTIPSVNLSNSVLDVAAYSLTNIGLQTITGIDELTALNNLTITDNGLSVSNMDAIVADLWDYAITNAKTGGSFSYAMGNDALSTTSQQIVDALEDSMGWNSGTGVITAITNRYELEAVSFNLSSNYVLMNDIDLDGAGAVWRDSGDNIVSSPVPDGSLDISGCNNWYDDAVIKGTFTGSFDGNNHHIYNLAIQQQIEVEKHCGLFEQGSGCQISSLEVSGNMQARGAGTSSYSGGVIGSIIGSTSLVNKSISNVNISNVNCLSGERVGGFVGFNYSATITDCYSTGNVASSSNYVGGFVGFSYSSATITNCYSTGNVASSSNYVGGFVGFSYSSATITTSFCYGEVTGTSTTKGGFAGRNSTSTFTNCYFNADVNEGLPNIGNGETDPAQDITTLTEEEMRIRSNFTGFDFDTIWRMGKDYPELRAFISNIVLFLDYLYGDKTMNIPESGGILNIGALLNASADEIDVAANLADLTATMLGDDGSAISVLTIDSITGDDEQCQVVVAPIPIVGQIDTTDWQTALNTTTFDVDDGAKLQVGDELSVQDSSEELLVTDIDGDTITVTRAYNGTTAEALNTQILTVTNRGSVTVGAYDDVATEITVVDGSLYTAGDTMDTAAGETLTVDSVAGNVLTVIRDAVSPDVIADGEPLYINDITTFILALNTWTDYETRTTFNVVDSTIFEVGDTLEVVDGATPEEMTITDVGDGQLTVERGTPADAIGDATYLKILNRDNGIPVGTYTLVLSSPVGTIVTRNISVDVLSDEAFDTYYSATLLTGIKTKTDALKGGIRDRFNT